GKCGTWDYKQFYQPFNWKKLKIAAFGYNFERKVDELKSELTKYMSYIANQQYDLSEASFIAEVVDAID
ncbi:hypothetical protein Tco_0752390, partial [Tanacetum coccineum]